MTLHFASLFDHNYLARGEALFDSLKKHCPEFKFYALCLDERAHRQIAEASRTEPRLIAIRLAELEEDDPALLSARKNRSLVVIFFIRR
jgi:lipopolysaccharide biosynthesis glycosyltransferase